MSRKWSRKTKEVPQGRRRSDAPSTPKEKSLHRGARSAQATERTRRLGLGNVVVYVGDGDVVRGAGRGRGDRDEGREEHERHHRWAYAEDGDWRKSAEFCPAFGGFRMRNSPALAKSRQRRARRVRHAARAIADTTSGVADNRPSRRKLSRSLSVASSPGDERVAAALRERAES